MKYIKKNKIYFERRIKGFYEHERYIFPTIVFRSDSIGTLYLWQFKICWWQHWYKIYISFHVFSTTFKQKNN